MEMTRRELLKASAVAGGVVWAAPMLTASAAWGSTETGACACDGAVVYAKFAPGNSQTCQNQCLQPGNVTRLNFDCLVGAGVLRACDDVNSNSSTASLEFLQGTRPLKMAIKTTNDCYVTRCTEGFSRIYHWSSSFNRESYPDAPNEQGPNPGTYKTEHNFRDPTTTAPTNDQPTAMFVTYKGGDLAPGTCKGNVDGSLGQVPTGTICGSTYRPADTCDPATAGDGCQGTQSCNDEITGMFMNTNPIGTTLNFIEMELCVTNLSKIPCAPIDCNKTPNTDL